MSDLKKKSRTWGLVLYPEDIDHVQYLKTMMEKSIIHGVVLHDKDLTNDDDAKKEHWHVVIRCDNPRYGNALVSDIGIKEKDVHFLKKVNSYKGYLKYMIHYGYPDKHQYSADDFFGFPSVQADLKRALEKDDRAEEDRIQDIFDFIDHSKFVSIPDVARYCVKNHKWDIMRRNYFVIRDYIKYHNDMVVDSYSHDIDALFIQRMKGEEENG